MLNGNEYPPKLADFQAQAESLLAKSEECLTHLELFSNDKDAIDCLLVTLQQLAIQAERLTICAMADFSRQIHDLLSPAGHAIALDSCALVALKECFTLLAWQLELIDVPTGQLSLEEDEQTALLKILALQTRQQSERPYATSERPLLH